MGLFPSMLSFLRVGVVSHGLWEQIDLDLSSNFYHFLAVQPENFLDSFAL